MKDERRKTNDERLSEDTSVRHSSLVVGPTCVTCSDEALEGQVISCDPQTFLALVFVQGVTIEVDVSLVDALASGDRVLIHGGVAITKL